MKNWCQQCLANRPAAIQPLYNGSGARSQSVRPIRHMQCLSVQRKITNISFISILNRHCSPYTIVRAIPLIIIDTLNRMLRSWLASHILQKTFKRFAPLGAHRNSTSTIIIPRFTIGFFASSNNVTPSIIFREMRQSVRARIFTGSVALQASARLCVSRFQAFFQDGFSATAIANTIPSGTKIFTILFGSASFKYTKTSKSLTSQINKFSIKGRHFVQSSILNNLASRVVVSDNFLQPASILT